MEFLLDGETRRVEGDTRQPLLYLLRNECDRPAVRYGCGTGQCGACTVMLDGVADQSCQLTVATAENRRVVTAHGLSDDPVGAVVLQAFVDVQAAQCGYCIGGMLVSLTALLTRHATPGEQAIRACLGRHLCRCGTHLRILRAARLASERLSAKASS